ncbi:MAG TPA: SPFH domain-containing protein [Fimbriimonadaceae bacterium]|nr:SPFH domain-containing protein [Fimbriimonadaceae bacterium]
MQELQDLLRVGPATLVLFVVGLGLLAWILSWRKICRPNEALVITGKKQRLPDGRVLRSTPITGGGAWAFPVFRKVDRLSLALMEVPIMVNNAYSKGGIAMNLDAIANVKISSNRLVLNNAIERFLESDSNELRRVAKETLEGHLRGVVADLTPEQVNEDRLKFVEALTKESEEDLNKLGLHLDTLKILHVSDEVNYLDATGRKAIANILRSAEIAESDAKRAAEQAESQNSGRANVRRAEADAAIAKMRNELRKIKADLEAKVKSEEERTTAAAREARATGEQHLQKVRAELEAIRLQADRVLPSDAGRQAQQFKARGDAAEIRERGAAVAQALELIHQAWKEAGPSAMQISIIEDLEAIMESALKGVRKVDVKALNVVDSGDGRTLSNYISAYPNMLGEVFAAVDKTVGIDIPGALAGRKEATN